MASYEGRKNNSEFSSLYIYIYIIYIYIYIYYMYIYIQTPPLGQDKTQGQFFF